MLAWFLIILQIVILLLAYFALARLFYIFTTLRAAVPYVPTPRGAIKKMAEVSGLTDCTMGRSKEPIEIVDLGSGSGKMLFHLARYAPKNAALIGIEKSRLLSIVARARRLASKHRHKITLIQNDWTNFDLRNARYVFIFLTRPSIESLRVKFETELQKNACIASYMFQMKSDQFSEEKTSWLKIPIYVYRKL
ncbi:MAG: hypothetical protein A2249_03115 [Candidatus Jacksonbacteria bacterium RIFOXYA2_FULL_44_7]|uniref:Methyltransferase domain-containing protein n=1 Tax=Candidatus Jacksonbacteria bacterium RIFCSPLOWO2_02_FULL_44_20 TaxID=1798460 RepID=A0A1G2A7E9_9BACT|nr:MAG: hypothetical protein UW39_C0005G0012 [Parcubacteria group bacterium GW2011_GWC2_44_17]KKT48355.1 MAG: hypothetical protein UW40_C0046G0003 [Parcubacteria group bacterium GW2011_GWF2_44_17]OGY70215.1 MAG: hypothetical protein A3E05_03465 [Candidatus Jacksonbacteria bacterium RIFCSPHIGHO2_12_FULL_44_12]OGY70235.1 MAG: hypothetical protein A3C00_03105 [Candidatus Jacksonbacteria bacterium RIFCSPHIGHO2_02_FULL_44_25]OGY72833.1 MAG: hypothetical protein A3H61_04560 [Candidatus Jacksonbacteri